MSNLNIFLLVVVIFTQVSLGQKTVPGVIVGHSPASTNIYLGSPSIAILDDGTYIASYQPFGKKLKNKGDDGETTVAISKDKGKTWQKISSVEKLWWANIFLFQGSLYLMGTEGEYGPLSIRKSQDNGHTWSHPSDSNSGLLRNDQEYHTAPMPIVVHNGRIFRAIEDRNPPEEWGVNFRALVISAPIDSDLLKASSWTTSNRLRYNQKWPGRAWLEGNIIVNPKGELVNILRNDFKPEGGRACLLEVSDNGKRVRFKKKTGFIDFPGGCKKFTIRYDSISKRYWSLTNYIPKKYKGKNPERTRNTLALVSSSDLNKWSVHKILLQDPDVQHTGFQYADWQFDGADIITLIRTAFIEPDGTKAHNQHDSNYIMFYRVPTFRQHMNEVAF